MASQKKNMGSRPIKGAAIRITPTAPHPSPRTDYRWLPRRSLRLWNCCCSPAPPTSSSLCTLQVLFSHSSSLCFPHKTLINYSCSHALIYLYCESFLYAENYLLFLVSVDYDYNFVALMLLVGLKFHMRML